MKRFKKTPSIRAAALRLGIVVLATACGPKSDDLRERGPRVEASRIQANADVVTVRVGARSFYIPHTYFPTPPPSGETDPGGIYLRVVLPDFSPCCSTEESNKTTEGSRQMNIVARDRANEAALGEGHTSIDKSELSFDERIGLSFMQSRHYAIDRVYFGANGGSVTTILACDRKEIRSPTHCYHSFDHLNLRITASYDSALAPQWREMETSIKALLERFAKSN